MKLNNFLVMLIAVGVCVGVYAMELWLLTFLFEPYTAAVIIAGIVSLANGLSWYRKEVQ